jgi:hypothetical protein
MRTATLIALLALAACDAQPPAPAASTRPFMQEGRTLSGDRGVAWLLNSEGLFRYDSRASHRVPITLPEWEWASEPYACLPDLARGPRGELVVTSNVVPKLWRVDPETLAVTVHALELDADHDKDVGFAGLVFSPLHPAYFAVSQLHGSLWLIDPALQTGRKIRLEDLADSSAEVETAFIRAACLSTAPRT